MKRIISAALVVFLLLALTVTAMAAELAGCTVSADSISAAPGQTVTVAIRISGNPGFTNFGIALDYDRTQLELLSIRTAQGEETYLCGEHAAVNENWTDEEEKTFGYAVAACPEVVTEDGILFAAVFRVSEDFSGSASVQPVVRYLRTNQGLLSVFESIPAGIRGGTVSTLLAGDYDGSGDVDVFDVSGLFRAVSIGQDFPEEDLPRLDVNGDGSVDVFDAAAIYDLVMGGR